MSIEERTQKYVEELVNKNISNRSAIRELILAVKDNCSLNRCLNKEEEAASLLRIDIPKYIIENHNILKERNDVVIEGVTRYLEGVILCRGCRCVMDEETQSGFCGLECYDEFMGWERI